jgi:hypothetical protein
MIKQNTKMFGTTKHTNFFCFKQKKKFKTDAQFFCLYKKALLTDREMVNG